MNLIVIEQPTIEPVTLDQVYAHLRLTPDPGSPTLGHPDDDMLLRQIKVARVDCENMTHRAFVKQKLRMVTNPGDSWWPWLITGWSARYRSRGIELLRPPFLYVDSVSYYDDNNALQVVDPTEYFVSEDSPARLYFRTSYASPSVYERPDAMRIDYYAGYTPLGSPEDDFVTSVPEPIKAAILLGVELQYEALAPEQRERIERTQQSLLDPYTILVIA